MTNDSPGCGPLDRDERARLRALLGHFQVPSTARGLAQVINTIVPYVLIWWLMYQVKGISWWLTGALAVIAGALLVRIFIFLHDCGHGSFFRSRWANAALGFVCGLLTFTPYHHWRWQHAIHHGTSGHLDKRGVGDIPTMTVQEYLDSTRWRRFSYRFRRNPFVLFAIAPLFIFLFRQRFAAADASRRERLSVWFLNIALVLVAIFLSRWLGFTNYVVMQLVALMVAGASGVWLFYVQHQFDGTYWERGGQWNYTAAALQGSSYYKLPRVLQWLSGNIGFHHIHHLSPGIPNYNLERCHRADPVFQRVKPVTLVGGFASLRYRLWDEAAKKLVSFARVRDLLRAHRP